MAGRSVSPGLEWVPWETQKSPALDYIWFLRLPGNAHAPAACTQTLVPGHLEKLGQPVSPEIQREEGQAEIDVFLELSCFFHDPADVGNLISGSSAFSKTGLNIWKFVYC